MPSPNMFMKKANMHAKKANMHANQANMHAKKAAKNAENALALKVYKEGKYRRVNNMPKNSMPRGFIKGFF
jgi:hypothetical protein